MYSISRVWSGNWYNKEYTYLLTRILQIIHLLCDCFIWKLSSLQQDVTKCRRSSLLAIPGAPVSVRLIGISEDSITIEWNPPSTDGGRPITRYVIEKREPHSQYWAPVSTVSPRTTVYQIQNLAPSSSYYFRVAAENEEGIGYYREFVEPVRPMKPKSKSLVLLSSSKQI